MWLRLAGTLMHAGAIKEVMEKAKVKESTRLNYLIKVVQRLYRDVAERKSVMAELKPYLKELDLRMCEEEADKAKIPSWKLMQKLITESGDELKVLWGLMIPTGCRYSDAARLKKRQLVWEGDVLTIHFKRAKNILRRRHQRRVSFTPPERLLREVRRRWKKCKPDEAVVQVSYKQALKAIKRHMGRKFTTYSIRRFAFWEMCKEAKDIEEITSVTRLYLPQQLPDERSKQLRLTAWSSSL